MFCLVILWYIEDRELKCFGFVFVIWVSKSSLHVSSLEILKQLVKKHTRVEKTFSSLINCEISIWKFFAECLEYAKYVNITEASPVLSAASQTHTVSKCGIVETPLILGGQMVNENEFPHMVNSGWYRVEINRFLRREPDSWKTDETTAFSFDKQVELVVSIRVSKL